MNNYKLIFFDFEVFKYDWLVVFIEYETRKKTVIINDPEELERFYNENKENIFCGYNSRQYDQFIFKGILFDLIPWDINKGIIEENKKGYQLVRNADSIPFYNFDISNGFRSLKELEGFMGSMIKESSIPFDINRKITEDEIEETVGYCTHDVEQSIEVFNNKKEEFDSQLALIEAFNLSMIMFNKTKAQLSAHILGAIKTDNRKDEFNLTLPDTLNISNKYKYVLEWYQNPDNQNYSRELNTIIAGVPHTFAWGGVHGAINNYYAEGIILCCDVASLYPSIMIEYGFLSRNVTNPELYRQIRDTRLELKRKKDPKQAPYKIVLNGTFGASKDQYNDLFDPLMANNVCVAGQLLLLDLIDKIEPYCELIQSNTDGLFMKVDSMETVEKIKLIAKEWETRTRLDLEWDIYNKIYQKDVNNYIIIPQEKPEKYKSKGAYIKKLSNIDYDLPIVNKSLVNYFIYNKPVEDTINECDELREFQKIVKVSSLYKYALHGDKKIKEKVLRVFASTEENACGVFKVKSKDRIEKIGNTPEKCFINNENIIGVKIQEYLDKQYYIDMAKKRLSDFLDVKTNKKPSGKSDIKSISISTKEKVMGLLENDYDTFTDFLIAAKDNKIANSTQIEILTKLNYFNKFGKRKKLLKVLNEFFDKRNKYDKKTLPENKEKIIESLKFVEDITKDEDFSLTDIINIECEYLGEPKSKFEIDRYKVFILDVNATYSPKIKVYGLSSGKTETFKVDKKYFNKHKVNKGDIIKVITWTPKQKTKKTVNGWENIEGFDYWLTEYKHVTLEI